MTSSFPRFNDSFVEILQDPNNKDEDKKAANATSGAPIKKAPVGEVGHHLQRSNFQAFVYILQIKVAIGCHIAANKRRFRFLFWCINALVLLNKILTVAIGICSKGV